MTIAIVVLQALILLGIGAAAWCAVQIRRDGRQHRDAINLAVLEGTKATMGSLERLSRRLEVLIEGQRLSTILRLEPASFKVTPAEFEPNRAAVKVALLAELKKQWARMDMSTRTYAVLQSSGWGVFVDQDTFTSARKALARLFANDDFVSAQKFCEELVDKL